MAVRFHFQKGIALLNRRQLKRFISQIFELEGKKLGALDFVFCSNAHLLNINQVYLQHDYFTDIITFDLSEDNKILISGEIYISVDMVKENALRFNVDEVNELYRVMFHGVLHLCGYNDKTKAEKGVMRNKEDYYLQMFHGEHLHQT